MASHAIDALRDIAAETTHALVTGNWERARVLQARRIRLQTDLHLQSVREPRPRAHRDAASLPSLLTPRPVPSQGVDTRVSLPLVSTGQRPGDQSPPPAGAGHNFLVDEPEPTANHERFGAESMEDGGGRLDSEREAGASAKPLEAAR